MQTPTGRPDRTLIVIVSIIVLVVILAFTVVLTRGNPPKLDPTTPEGVVQDYTSKIVAGDWDKAKLLLSDSVQGNCELQDPGPANNLRLTLVSSSIKGSNATVRVNITQGQNVGPFGSNESQFEDVFRLVEQDGTWAIDSAPWPLTICFAKDSNG